MLKEHDVTRKSALLLIYTGGTIGMKQDMKDLTLKPFDFSQILEEVPEITKFAFKIDTKTFDPPIDSSDGVGHNEPFSSKILFDIVSSGCRKGSLL